jgi:hypothetical protein
MAEDECHSGICDIEFYIKFSMGVLRNIHELATCIQTQKHNYKVIGYGAAAKASTIINALETPMEIDYIVDDNPLKVGKFMPSTNIPILPTSILANEESDLAIWITAHNFQKEIVERIKAARPNRNDILINYIPEIKTQPI